MDTPMTRDRELELMTKEQLLAILYPTEIALPSKVKKTPKSDLIQQVLEKEQQEKFQQSQTSKVQSQTSGPWTLRQQSKKYDPHQPTKDAFRLKKMPSSRNIDALVAWSKMYGFGEPVFVVDQKGLVMEVDSPEGVKRYDLWSNGGSYFGTLKS